MEVRFEKSLHTYTKKVEELLLKKEAANNLMLGLLYRGFNNVDAYQEGVYLGLVEKDNNVIYAFMQTPPQHWILADVTGINEAVIDSILDFFHQEGVEVPSVVGPTDVTKAFVQGWTRRSGKAAQLEMNQFIYQLDHVNVTPQKNGNLIEATGEHRSLIAKWFYRFGQEANMYITRLKAENMAISYIENRSIYLWVVDGKPVSMANNSRKSKNGVTINSVFTPNKFKRNGYATSTVASLSSKLLNDGFKFCNLYTDAANPTSNRIYRRIGFYEVGTSIVFRFNE
ncbi:hypothetical protein SAMN05216389_12531 [Oceanobacillus limi]|uniref:N-acetyltransferase domain-containing protein n=1 Tax=Oceanobacillus limi TaxID=930131 RepID=A0A1I0GWT6_9BACI|nr:GNAT family N-acetyltransferase [Oceanobacillus limi]SET75836.1 hypothetical protein SAMN05216389_12531 [Oceanobacillus limi]